MLRCRAVLSFALALLSLPHAFWAQTPVQGSIPEQPDPYIWLEQVDSPRSLAWVKQENERTAKVLEADPRFAEMQAAALKVLESPDRIPRPDLRDGTVYNLWRDAAHSQGILRRTGTADYARKDPRWQTVLDYDALSAKDGTKWVAGGLSCLYPYAKQCMAALSAGGEDADTLREFDLQSGSFVPNGFTLPRSKQGAEWLDADTLLVARDWGPGTMTESGYPFVIKIWKRGQPLEQAKEIFRGAPTDTRADAEVLHDTKGHQAVLLVESPSFFAQRYSLWTPDGGPRRLALPEKATVDGLFEGRLIVTLREAWQGFPQGSVVALDLAAATADPAHPQATAVFTPTATEFAQQVDFTRDRLVLTTLENVQGRAYVYAVSPRGAWSRKPLEVGANQTVAIASTDTKSNTLYLSRTGFLTPSSLDQGDAESTRLTPVKQLPPQFDASTDVVEQREATSKDGTRVPYFLVHRKDLQYNGENPTLLSAYGGFEVSETPFYSPVIGKLWLERGGVYVLANIRGGGEFGPAWHEAGLTVHRQRIYDDFTAVGEDLVARKVTSPRRLGIYGGSNGGLLMGVEMTQHPELWNAVIIDVPLLDMLRFEHIAAGASWTGEYGSVSNQEQRQFLASISPYNRLRPDAHYPEPLILTTTKDDRVGPVHARKFAARMEEFHEPFFYREIVEGGHGSGADLKETAGTDAAQYVYLTRKLMDPPQTSSLLH